MKHSFIPSIAAVLLCAVIPSQSQTQSPSVLRWVNVTTLHAPASINDADFMGSISRILSVDADTSVRVWDADAGTMLHRMSDFDRPYTGYALEVGASYSADGKYILTFHNQDTTALLWDAVTGEQLKAIGSHSISGFGGRNILPERFHPDARSFLTTYSWFVHEWNSSDQSLLQEMGPTALAHTTRQAYYSPDGSTILTISSRNGDSYGMVNLFDVSTGQKVFEHAPGTYLIDVRFSPDGTHVLASAYKGKTVVIDWKKRTVVRTLTTHDDYSLTTVVHSPDGTRLFPLRHGSGTSVRNAFNGAEIFRPIYYGLGPRSAIFTPDSRHLIIGFMDGAIRMYDAANGSLVDSLVGHTGAVHSIRFSSDGERIITAGADSTIRVWEQREIAGVDDNGNSSQIPSLNIRASSNRPGEITISYTTASSGRCRLLLYDALGREVRRFVDDEMQVGAGLNRLTVERIAAGRYFLVLDVMGRERITRSVVVQ